MRPEWLQVPAAEPAPLVAGGDRLGPVPGHVGTLGAVRLVRFVSGPTAGVRDGAVLSPLERAVLAVWLSPRSYDCERLDPGTLNGLGRGSGDASTRIGPGRPQGRALDKHQLDVALSVGRHAAERAKLAGRVLLIGSGEVGVRPPGVTVHDPMSLDEMPTSVTWCDPYLALRQQGCFAVAALVGMAIAGAQIGLPVLLHGESGRFAATIARRLHLGLGAWLSLLPGSGRVASDPPVAGGRRLDLGTTGYRPPESPLAATLVHGPA